MLVDLTLLSNTLLLQNLIVAGFVCTFAYLSFQTCRLNRQLRYREGVVNHKLPGFLATTPTRQDTESASEYAEEKLAKLD